PRRCLGGPAARASPHEPQRTRHKREIECAASGPTRNVGNGQRALGSRARTAAMLAAMTTDDLAETLATWFGCGLAPKAPGTVGSLGALPLHVGLRLLPPVPHVAAVVAVTAIGTWAAHRVAVLREEEDPQRVVIDEVAGVLIAMGLVRRRSLKTQALAW